MSVPNPSKRARASSSSSSSSGGAIPVLGGATYRLYRIQRPEVSSWINICKIYEDENLQELWPYYHFKEGDHVWVKESHGTASNDYSVPVRVYHRHKRLFLDLYDHMTEHKPDLKNNLGSLVTAIETDLVGRGTHEMRQNAVDFRRIMFQKFPDFERWKHGITKEELTKAMVITGWIEKRNVVLDAPPP